MTVNQYSDYSELFSSCVAYYDGDLTSAGLLAQSHSNEVLDGAVTSGGTSTGTNRFGLATCTRLYAGSSYFTIDDASTALRTALTADPVAFTLAQWIMVPVGTAQAPYYLFQNHNSTTNNGFYTLFQYSGEWMWAGQFALKASWSDVPTPIIHGLSLGVWYLIVVTISGSTVKAYANGVLDATDGTKTGNRTTLGSSPRTICIGHSVEDTAKKFIGNMGEIFMFNTAFSQAQVTQLYDLTSKKYISAIVRGVKGA